MFHACRGTCGLAWEQRAVKSVDAMAAECTRARGQHTVVDKGRKGQWERVLPRAALLRWGRGGLLLVHGVYSTCYAECLESFLAKPFGRLSGRLKMRSGR